MYWPSPVRARWCSAARMAMVAFSPVARSTVATPTLLAAPSAGPVIDISPDSAWTTKS